MHTTKLIHGFKGLPYSERHRKLNLQTLEYRRLRGDMKIELFKMLNGKYSNDACSKLKFIDCKVNCTTGYKLKIFQDHVQYNLCTYF